MKDAMSTKSKDEQTNARQANRVMLQERVKFHAPHNCEGKSIDIGAGGLGVEMDQPLAVGTLVEVEIFNGKATALGTVRSSVAKGNAYRIGIQFKEEDWAVMEMVMAYSQQKG